MRRTTEPYACAMVAGKDAICCNVARIEVTALHSPHAQSHASVLLQSQTSHHTAGVGFITLNVSQEGIWHCGVGTAQR